MIVRSLISWLMVLVLSSGSHAENRIGLLIGNQAYNEKVGPLKNPHNDIALVGAALEEVGFKITRIKDAGYKAIDTALKRHGARVKIPSALSITRATARPIRTPRSTI